MRLGAGTRARRSDLVCLQGKDGTWRALLARSFWLRLRGLVGRGRADGPLATGGLCLLFPRCSSVHTFGMALPLDLAFIDASGKVLRAERSVPPLRIRSCPGAHAALERRARPDLPWPADGDGLHGERLDAE